MTGLTARHRALIALADELTPAKSLVRLDAATSRVVTTVSVVGALLTGFGLLAAGLPGLDGAPRVFAVMAVVLAFVAVVCALGAQTLTIVRGLNPNNLKEVERWYLRRFEVRAPLTRAASVFLVLAVVAAGTAAVLATTGGSRDRVSLAVTRVTTSDTVIVDVTFRGVEAGDTATVTVSADGRVVAQAVATPAPDGVVTRTLTVEKVAATATVVVSAEADDARCTADGAAGQKLRVNCTPA